MYIFLPFTQLSVVYPSGSRTAAGLMGGSIVEWCSRDKPLQINSQLVVNTAAVYVGGVSNDVLTQCVVHLEF